MHPAVSLTVTLFMTLMIGMPIIGLLVSGRQQEDKSARIWFLAIALDSLQIPILATKAVYTSWWTFAFPGVIPVMFFYTLSIVLSRELARDAQHPWAKLLGVGAFYLLVTSTFYSLQPIATADHSIQSFNNLLYLGFSLWLCVQAFILARKSGSRAMYLVSLGFAVSLLGYGARAWWHFVLGVTTPTFEFSPIANFQVWSVSVNLILMTIGYLGYTLEKAQKERLRYAAEAAEAKARESVAEQYNNELRRVIAERDQMVIVNSRFLNLGALAVFNSAIVHEISQPLQAAMMCLDNIRAHDHDLGGELASDLDEAVRLTGQAGEVVSVLRRMMRNVDGTSETVDIAAQVREILPIIAGDSRQRGIRFESSIPDEPIIALGNSVMLQRLIFNLVANAFDAFAQAKTPNPILSITLRNQADPHRASCPGILLTCTDNGPGMTEEQMDHLFKPFATSKVDGLGVGLSLAQILVRKWGGHIAATLNAPEEGITFSIWLPTV